MIATSFAVGGVAIATLVVVLAITMVLRRFVRQRQDRRRARFVEPLRTVLVRLVTDPTGDPGLEHETLLRTAPSTWEALEPTVLDMLRKVRGEARDRLVALVVAKGTVTRMRRRTLQFGAVRRAHAAELLGLLRQREARDDLVRLLRDHDPEVRIVAARALGELGDPSAAQPLLDSLGRTRSVPLRVVARSLARLGPEAATTLVGGLGSENDVTRAVCAEIAGLLGVTAAHATLLDVIEHDGEPDVRIRAARALGRIGMPSALPALVRATDPTNPAALRAVAARALGDLGGPGPVAFLEVLLADPDHRVSANAGQALSRVGAVGLVRLRQLSLHPGDAGDCARESLALHALSHGLTLGPSPTLGGVPEQRLSSVARPPGVADQQVSIP